VTTVLVDGTLEEIEAAGRGPIAWDVAVYGSMLQAPWRDVRVIPLPHRPRRGRLPVRRRAGGGGGAPPDLGIAAGDAAVGAPRAIPRWELLGRVAREVDVARAPRGADVAFSHLRTLRTVPRLPLVWSTNGVVPEIWSWRAPTEATSVRDRFVATHAALARRAERIVVWTHWGAEHLVGLAKIPSGKVAVARPVLVLPSPDGPGLGVRHDERLRVVFVGRAGWLKGLPALLAAVATTPEVELHVVGPDAPRDAPPGTHWHGPCGPGATAALVEDADVLAVPAHAETYGVTLLEAMRSGVPVIGSTAGTHAELLGDAGLLVTAGDVDAVARAMQELRDPATRAELGRRGRERYERELAPGPAAAALEPILTR